MLRTRAGIVIPQIAYQSGVRSVIGNWVDPAFSHGTR